MFINCPTCRALVATDPATDRPPAYCPICSAPIDETAAAPPAVAHDRTAMRDDASRRLEEMLSSLDHDADAALATQIAPSIDRRDVDSAADTTAAAIADADAGAAPVVDAGIDPGTHLDTAHDPDDHVRGRAQLRPPGPPPIDVIRSPVDAMPDAGLDLPAAASMIEDRRSIGIAGFLRRLSGRRVAVAAPPDARGELSADPTDAADDAHSRDPHDAEATETAAAALMPDPVSVESDAAVDGGGALRPSAITASITQQVADACGDVAVSPTAGHDLPIGSAVGMRDSDALAIETESTTRTGPDVDAVAGAGIGNPDPRHVAIGPTIVPSDHDARLDTRSHADADFADACEAERAPLRPALVRPVDRPRVEVPGEPLPLLDSADTAASTASTQRTIAPSLVSTLALGAPTTRSAPSFARSRRRPSNGVGWASAASIAVLSLALAVQLLLADRATLAADARWRPVVTTLCDTLGCRLPPWREPTALALVDRDVRPHPTRPGVLRVTATFRNDARWPQPWPRLALTLSDVEGARLAMRDFGARDYLGAAPRQDTLAVGQSASIAMDVVEPDARSVAFDFLLH